MTEEVKKIRARKPGHFNVRLKKLAIISPIYIPMLVIALSLYIPVVWLVINSFKGDFEYYLSTPFAFAKKALWSNYAFIAKMQYTINTDRGRLVYGIWDMFANSMIFSLASSVYPPFVTLVCAFIISRYRFPGRMFIFNLGIIVMILPILGSGAAGMILYRALGIYDNMFLLILVSPSVAFSGMAFLLFYGAFQGLPRDYMEAAFIDGAGHLRVFLTIMLPMIMPVYGMFVLLGFIGSWNNWETFLYWLPSRANIALGMYEIQRVNALVGATMPQVLAGFVIVAVPTSVMYLAAHPLMLKNFNIGGLKG